MILAIDTSTEWTSVAVYSPEEGVLAEETWRSHRQQTVQLMPTVQRLMNVLDMPSKALTGVAVATGPGSFSGVRVGISAAKGVAYALEVPLWGVPTLDVMAYTHAAVTAAQVCAVLDMGRRRFAWALYRTKSAKWSRLTPYAAGTLDEMARGLQEYESNVATLVCGELSEEAGRHLRDDLGVHIAIAPRASSLRRAGYLAELAAQRAARGEKDDPATLQALFVQAPADEKAQAATT
jgi:tRNA threonylcarbamoyladenosine biosynthesis protein TsaB